MISLILGYLIIQIISIFFAIKLKKNIGSTFVITVLSIIVTLYLFGLLNILPIGVYFIELTSLGMLIYECRYFYKHKDKLRSTIFNKENTIFTLIFIGLSVIHEGRMISSWDEFSHWGDVVKAMFTIDDFATSSKSMSQFQSYPPAMSLFQYFLMKLGNKYIEGHMFIAAQLFFVSLIMTFVSKNKKVIDALITAVILLFVPSLIFNNFYTTIFIDCILGLVFGYILLSIIVNEYDKHQIINLILSIFTLVLLKDVGIFLALIAIAMIIVDLIFVKKKIKFKRNFYEKNKKYIWLVAGGIAAIAIAKATWNFDININDARISFGNEITFRGILNFITRQNLGYRGIVIGNFIRNLYTENIISSIVNFNTITLSVFLTLLLIPALKNVSNSKYYIGCILSGLLIYIIGLVFIYCFKFTEYEAVRLASYSRYISIYFVAMIFIVTAMITSNCSNKVIPLLVVLLFVPYTNFFAIRYTVREAMNVREPYETAIANLPEEIDGDDKIYVLSQNTSGFDYWVLKYSLRPNEINENNTWSIGKPYNKEDIWTRNYSQTEWMNKLIEEEYDYVYIYKADNQFISQYAELFITTEDIDEQTLFIVDKKIKKLKLVK